MMQGKTSWWLLGVTVAATAVATLAVLEYAHRHPDSQLSRLLRKAHLLAQHPSTSARHVPSRADYTSPQESRSLVHVPPPALLPSDVLEQSLRELRLLDQWAGSHTASTPQTGTPTAWDEFSPEAIPVPPRSVSVEAGSSPETVPIPDGRVLAPVASVEPLPVAPQPQPEVVPNDLDEETARPGEAPSQDCDKPEIPPSDEPAEDEEDPTGDTRNFSGVWGLCNAPGCVGDWVAWLQQCLSGLYACGNGFTRGALPAQCCEESQRQSAVPTRDRARVSDTSSVPDEKTSEVPLPQGQQPCSGNCDKAPAPLIRKVYPVADLIQCHEDGQALCELVTNFVASDTWQCCASCAPRNCACSADNPAAETNCGRETVRGRIEYFSGACCLVVLHTPQVQKEVAEFLGELRRVAQLQELDNVPAAAGTAVCPPKEPEHVWIVPVIRPVLVPVAVPVPVGVPDQELPPPQFRLPQDPPDDDQDLDHPAQRLVPPRTPEKLPECLPPLVAPHAHPCPFWNPWRGAPPGLPPSREALPQILPVRPMDPHCPQDSANPPAEEPHDCPDLEDVEPLETDLHPPIG